MATLNSKDKRKVPKTVQGSIPYKQVYDNGVIETEPGTFTKAYALHDVNFVTATDERQLTIFAEWGKFLNSFPVDSRFQILIQNRRADLRKFLEELRFQPQKDGLNAYRQELNGLLLDRVAKAKNNLTQTKTCIVSIKDDSVAHAMEVLTTIDADVDKSLRAILVGAQTEPMTLEERLRSLHGIYNQANEFAFENSVDENGKPVFDLQRLYSTGGTSKEAVAPDSMAFKGNHFTVGDTFGRVLFMQNVPSYLTTNYIEELADIPYGLLLSAQYEPIPQGKAYKMVNNQITALNSAIADKQIKASKEGYSTGIISPDLYRAQEQANELMEDMVRRDQRLYYVSLLITVFGSNLQELEDATRRVITISNKHNAPIRKLVYQQEAGFNSCLPLCISAPPVKRLLTTEAASVLLPYSSRELHHRNGNTYGINQLSKSVIICSRLQGPNHNGLFFGESGSGKSFSAKAEMLSVLLRSDKNRVYIIDPEAEYSPMVEALGGKEITLASGSTSFVNPMDMDWDYGGDTDPLGYKSSYLISMIEIMFGRHMTLTAQSKSIIDRCVYRVYDGYIRQMRALHQQGAAITIDKESMPTLLNLYNEIAAQPEPEARTIASTLEIYARGSQSLFANRSNIDTEDASIISYNIKNLGAGMKELGLFVCLNDIWNAMIANHKRGLWTWIYIDEFYLLLRSENATSFLVELWKRARKWQGVPTGIMQNAEDLQNNPETRNIVNNTSFVLMHPASKMDRDILGDLLQLSDEQLKYLATSQSGTGLLYFNGTAIPFDNRYPKDTQLYKLMQTSRQKDNI